MTDLQPLLRALRARASGCFLCRWIAEDLEANGKLTDDYKNHPDGADKPIFPVGARKVHLKLEELEVPS